MNKKLVRSEQTLEDAKLFIDNIQKKRKEIQSSGSTSGNDENGDNDEVKWTLKHRDSRDSEATLSRTAHVSQEAININNKMRDENASRQSAPRVVNDKYFDIQVANSNAQQSRLASPSAAAHSYSQPAFSNSNRPVSVSSEQHSVKKSRLNRLLKRDSQDGKEPRKNIFKNLFSRR